MAACPLHVECREICAAVSCGDFDAAYNLYSKSVPFPGIVSRLCTEPCGNACVRRNLGGAISMRKIEESVCIYGRPSKKRGFLPKRTERVAVVGGSLYGLTAALELAKKGYHITVLERTDRLGGSLLKEAALEQEVLDKDLAVLKEYPITITYETEIADVKSLESEYDAVVDGAEPSFPSVVHSIYEGRRMAITLDRQLKKVSLDAGREREGSFETELHVNTQGVEEVPPVVSTDIYTKEEAMEEASRCLDCKCLECVKSCAFLQHFKTFPRKYMREVYNNLSIAMGTRHANKMINACSICGQCKAICPNGLDVGAVVKDARQIMVESGKMPQSAFAFALEDMEQANASDCILTRHQAGYESSRYVFFPGCQLPASAPKVTARAYEDLTKRLEGGVGILLGCCGITADWAGQEKLYRENLEELRKRWQSLGSPEIITACPTCYDLLTREFGEEHCTGIWDILLEYGCPGGYKTRMQEGRDSTGQQTEGKETLHIRDACGAREYPHIHESIRRLLGGMDYQIDVDEYEKDRSPCCGFGGLAPYSSPQVASEAARLAVPRKDWNYVTYCMNCRDRYTKEGAQAVHLLELLYDADRGVSHRVPTWSVRQDNRADFCRHLKEICFGEKTKEAVRYPLEYPAELAEILESRMILESSIRQAIDDAESRGNRILHRPSGCRVARARVGYVTFWVWYRPLEAGYYVEKAYSHRMEIKEES